MIRKNGLETGVQPERDAKGRFGPGNRGKPSGARNKATQAALALLEGEAEALARKAVEMALMGDTVALKLCMDRIAPPRKDAAVTFDLPPLKDSSVAPDAARAVLEAVAEGNITPGEAETILKLVVAWRDAQERLESRRENEAIWGDLLPSLR
ncbi:hypothetical protein MCEREM21A_02355 [Sphingomonadaceae bacterium]